MPLAPLTLPPSAAFWDGVAQVILRGELARGAAGHDYSTLRVVVPTVAHIRQLQAALALRIARPFIPPRICTMPAWLALQPPGERVASDSERLMTLYAELRQHAWLKTLFSARSNTDLLPLAQTLLALCDELTQALLPHMQSAGMEARWEAALAQLAPGARALLSNEAQLVWSVWQTQLDSRDAHAARYAQMVRLAQRADAALLWVAPLAPDAFDAAFLEQYAQRQPVQTILLGWQPASVEPAYAAAWPELFEAQAGQETGPHDTIVLTSPPAGLALCENQSLEQEALAGAQTIIDWLAAGKTSIAIIAQDRVVARRIRALLERAQVMVADETGWKLSTTRAAASLAAWFDVVTSRAESVSLLDLLKSPYVFAELPDKSASVMQIELALRRANVAGGWSASQAALERAPHEQQLLIALARQAESFKARRSLAAWVEATLAALEVLQMRAALAADPAGVQLLEMLAALRQDCAGLDLPYSFAEWRAVISLQMETRPFIVAAVDRRVVMLPLNGARLRNFDAVLMVGADATHLPSQPAEMLFFANAVRRELGLDTRESRQHQQLRDFVELLQVNPQVVLCWQGHKDSEPNPLSPWVTRLQLCLQASGAARLPQHAMQPMLQALLPAPVAPPAPAAPQLLPTRLSASGYNTLVACPYQFFATRMLGLSALDELSDLPEKRDYGNWLHRILFQYHSALQEQNTPVDARAELLGSISERVFAKELEKNAGALGFYVRWKNAAPAYLNWANAREAQGWTFAFGEWALEAPLDYPGGAVTLHGRIDRIDRNAEGDWAVLDYKTKELAGLKTRLKEGEDQQLAFYGLLFGQPVSAAHYVALEATKEKTGDVEAPAYAAWQDALRLQLGSTLQAIAQGAPLKASGINNSCRYCDVRGLCRKGAW